MGTWGTGIKDNDTFADVYNQFFDAYNNGEEPGNISQKIIEENWETLKIEEEKNSIWFAIGLAQWETKSLKPEVFVKIEKTISSGEELEIWRKLGASESDIEKRTIALEKFLYQLKSDKPTAKARKKTKQRTPIFSTGDCLTFRMQNGNYGGAVVLATDKNTETAYNLVATTRINQIIKPTIHDFKQSEVLVCNFDSWRDKVEVAWYLPDFYNKNYSAIYEIVGKITIEIEYDINNCMGEGYLFKPMFTSDWNMKDMIERQIVSEETRPKPEKFVRLKELTIKRKWWKLW